MKIDCCQKIGEKTLQVKLVAETFEDIALLYDVGQRIKSPVEAYGGFLTEYVYLWINIPLRKTNPRWGFDNDLNK